MACQNSLLAWPQWLPLLIPQWSTVSPCSCPGYGGQALPSPALVEGPWPLQASLAASPTAWGQSCSGQAHPSSVKQREGEKVLICVPVGRVLFREQRIQLCLTETNPQTLTNDHPGCNLQPSTFAFFLFVDCLRQPKTAQAGLLTW